MFSFAVEPTIFFFSRLFQQQQQQHRTRREKEGIAEQSGVPGDLIAFHWKIKEITREPKSKVSTTRRGYRQTREHRPTWCRTKKNKIGVVRDPKEKLTNELV